MSAQTSRNPLSSQVISNQAWSSNSKPASLMGRNPLSSQVISNARLPCFVATPIQGRNPLSSQVISNKAWNTGHEGGIAVVIPYQVRSYQTLLWVPGRSDPAFCVVIPYQVRSYQTNNFPFHPYQLPEKSRNPLSSQVISNKPACR